MTVASMTSSLEKMKLRTAKPAVPTKTTPETPAAFRGKLDELLRKRFFFLPAFGIYGGVAGLYDYGPPGCALQTNIIDLWRRHFVLEEGMLEVDTTIMTPYEVLKTSGHVDRFTDYMMKDLKTGDFYRADHILKANLEKKVVAKETTVELRAECENVLAQLDGYGEAELQAFMIQYEIKSDLGNELGPVHKFNLMFGTDIGPTGQIKGFLRPETAQGHFVNFRKLLECNNEKLPFASAQIGRSFRNEISPRSGLLRVREFTMAEIEHYVHPDRKNHARFVEVADIVLNFLPADVQQSGSSQVKAMSIGEAVRSGMVNNETLGYFLARTAQFMWRIGVDSERIRFRQHMSNEMAHYASDCWDAEIRNSYGWIECVGHADRSCYDLSMHSQVSGERLVARERLAVPETVRGRRLVISKKEIGQAFKGDSRDIVAFLEGLSEAESEKLLTQVENGKVKLNLPSNGKSFVLNAPEMISMEDYEETIHVREYVPAVIEPSFGLGRVLYSLLDHSFWTREEDEQRCVLSLPPCVAPTKCLLVPLSSGGESGDKFAAVLQDLSKTLRLHEISTVIDDSSASIGKRYARNDEVGTPFGVTVDFQTLQDSTVTMRERDTTQQVRLPIADVPAVLVELVSERKVWSEIVEKYGLVAPISE